MLKLRTNLGFLLIFCTISVMAQRQPSKPKEIDDEGYKGNAFLMLFNFGGHLPSGDLADRFGFAGSMGMGMEWLTSSNYMFGAEFNYILGSNVKEDPLAIIRTTEGDIIGKDQALASVFLRQRAWNWVGYVGRLFSIGDKRRGVRFTVGCGYSEHRIRLLDETRTVTQITGEYKKGYDRLTGGLTLTQFLGWQNLARNRRANFVVGLDLQQGLTKTRRDWDFTEKRKLDGKRLDLRIGIRATWILPFYKQKPEEIYY